jgi:hypothetical protein
MTKIIIEIDKATEAQVKSLVADLAMSIEPWKRYIHYKIKNGNKIYRPQALRHKHQASGSKLDKTINP